MNDSFLSAPCGRLFSATMAVLAAGAGAVALIGPGPVASGFVIPALFLFGVVSAIMYVGMSLERFGGIAVVLTIALPPLGGLYYAALVGVVIHAGTGVGVVLIAMSLVPAFAALKPAPRRAAQTERSVSAPSRQVAA